MCNVLQRVVKTRRDESEWDLQVVEGCFGVLVGGDPARVGGWQKGNRDVGRAPDAEQVERLQV